MAPNSSILSAFRPTGKLRAAINVGNPILANKDATSGQPFGVSIDLATELAKRLAVELELAVFDTASKSVEAISAEQADFGFFAVDPERGASIAFTAPYVLIEGFFLVRNDSAIRRNEDVDHENNRVVVGKGSAYDLFLSRLLEKAPIVRALTSQVVVRTFLEQHLEVAAGVKQQLEADALNVAGLRLLPQRFMVIKQAMGIPKSRGLEAADYLRKFVEDMKSSGFVMDSLARHGIVGASVAPCAR
ncbi:MAG: ABC transporter substrate-binding protein [Acidobacteriota bacterium]|nr:ABC transporter substrate-binding protein [Acidobacteriota bacterium]